MYARDPEQGSRTRRARPGRCSSPGCVWPRSRSPGWSRRWSRRRTSKTRSPCMTSRCSAAARGRPGQRAAAPARARALHSLGDPADGGRAAAGRPRIALAVALVMGMAPATAELLKPLLAHPHAPIYGDEISAASWPSGHASAATALAMSVVLVAPHRLRPTVALLGAIFAAAVGFSLVLLAWHLRAMSSAAIWSARSGRRGRRRPAQGRVARSSLKQTGKRCWRQCAPGSHSGSDFRPGGPPSDESSLAARPRMKNRSESLFR